MSSDMVRWELESSVEHCWTAPCIQSRKVSNVLDMKLKLHYFNVLVII